MTINELRAYPNCGHYSNEEAEIIVRTLENLATVVFDYTCLQHGIVIDNQLDTNEEDKEITKNPEI